MKFIQSPYLKNKFYDDDVENEELTVSCINL